ncbi:MAG TPA: hypothetical protein VGK43_06555 [Solirubrobacterales bacterium]
MIPRQWIAPGILVTVLTLGANFVSAWAVDRYRTDGTERALVALRDEVREQNRDTKESISRINGRLDQMQKDGTEMIRLQERYEQMKAALADIRTSVNASLKDLRDSQEISNMQAQRFREELYRKGVL